MHRLIFVSPLFFVALSSFSCSNKENEIELIMDISVASPELHSLSDSQMILAGREYSILNKSKSDSINVSLFTLDMLGKTNRLYVFETGRLGDKGYPSFCLLKRNNLLMSYYTGTSDKSVIKPSSIEF